MRFSVDRDVLADAIAWVARALPARPPIPVLAGIELSADPADGGSLTLSTFDYEVSAKVTASAEVSDGGSVLVSGRMLSEISRLLPHQPVQIALEATKVVIQCGASTFTLLTMPHDEYPSLPSFPPLAGTIEAGDFIHAVGQVTVAASRDETNPRLTGVMIEIEGEKLSLMATDRYRLAIAEIPWSPASPDVSGTALIRAKVLSDIARSLSATEKLSLGVSADAHAEIIGFSTDGRATTSSLIDAADYPPVRRLFPESSPIHVVTELQPFIDAARRVRVVAERNTALRLAISEGQILLDAGTGDEAQASETIEARLDGEELTVAFNPDYLLDGLNTVGSKYVRLSLSHPNKPVLFAGQDEMDSDVKGSYQYLLVPIRYAG